MVRRGAALALVLAVSLLVLAAAADAKRRPGTPKARTVSAAIVKVERATPFASGRAAARRARIAFKKRQYCKASDALAAHHSLVAKRVKRARGRKARRTVTKLLVLDGPRARAPVAARRQGLRRQAVGGCRQVAQATGRAAGQPAGRARRGRVR